MKSLSIYQPHRPATVYVRLQRAVGMLLTIAMVAGLYVPPTAMASGTVTIILTEGDTWDVPSDWNPTDNTIHVIGAGGGGGAL